MTKTCPVCDALIILAKSPDGMVMLDPPHRHVYVLSWPTRKKPTAGRAHQGEPESIHAGVQYQYLAAHVCKRAEKKGKK